MCKGYTELGYAEKKSYVKSLECVHKMTVLVWATGAVLSHFFLAFFFNFLDFLPCVVMFTEDSGTSPKV